MKHFALVAALLFTPMAFAEDDAGVLDAGLVAEVVDAGAVDTDAGVADAGIKLVDGTNVDVVGIVQKAREAGHDKNWSILFIIAASIVVLTSAVRKVGGMFIPFLKTDRGGALLVLILGVSGGLVNALAAGATVTLDTVIAGMGVGFMSAGGFTVLKKLLFPSDAAEPKKS